MLRLSLSTLRERWPLFAGAGLTIALGVALVQSCLMVMVSSGEPEIPPGTPAKDAEQIREGYVGAATLLGMTVPLAMFLAVFVVGSTFAFTVAQRRSELALLRMLGGSRAQTTRLLLAEALLLGLVGSVIGIVLGVPLMTVQARSLIALGLLPDGFGVEWSGKVVPFSLGMGVGVALVGVLAAAYRAARIRPLDAVRGGGGAARVMTAGRWLWGLSSLAVTVLMVLAGQSADLLGALLIAMAVSVSGAVAMSQLSPLIVPLAGGLFGAVLRGSALGELARANLRDGVRRSASTAAPVIVLVALAVGLTGALNTLAEASGAELERNTDADLVVATTGADAARMRALPGVAAAAPSITVDAAVTTRQREEGRSWRRTHHFGIVAVDPAAYRRTHRTAPAWGSLDDLRGDTVAIGPALAELGVRGPTVALRIGGATRTLKIVARMRPALENGGDAFLLPLDALPAAATAGAPAEILVKLAPGASPDEAARRIAVGGARVRTIHGWARDRIAAQQKGTMGIIAALMGLSGVYAAVAAVNAILIAGTERRREFAVARVTGLDRGQVVRAALVEAFAVTSVGLVLGAAVAAAAFAGFQPEYLAIPWRLFFVISAGAYVVTGVASVVSTRFATRTPPVALVAARE